MTGIDPLALAGAKPRGKRPWFFDDRDTERLMTIVMALTQEVSVLRARLDTVERLLEEKGALTRGDIESYTPSRAAAEERGAWTQEYLARVLRILQQDREALSTDDRLSEDVAEELAST